MKTNITLLTTLFSASIFEQTSIFEKAPVVLDNTTASTRLPWMFMLLSWKGDTPKTSSPRNLPGSLVRGRVN